MEDEIIGDDVEMIEREVREIAQGIWGYDGEGEGRRGIRILLGGAGESMRE